MLFSSFLLEIEGKKRGFPHLPGSAEKQQLPVAAVLCESLEAQGCTLVEVATQPHRPTRTPELQVLPDTEALLRACELVPPHPSGRTSQAAVTNPTTVHLLLSDHEELLTLSLRGC